MADRNGVFIQEYITLDVSNVDLLEMVNNVSVLNSKSIKDKELQLNIKISEGILVNIDEPFFKNALHNLLSNAIKFSHPGGDITIKALEDEVNVTLNLPIMAKECSKKLKTLF